MAGLDQVIADLEAQAEEAEETARNFRHAAEVLRATNDAIAEGGES